MLRHKVRLNESDRFIAARSVEREKMIDRYNIKDIDPSTQERLTSLETPAQFRSAEPKSRTPLIIKDKKIISDKIYLSLLKTQLFKETNTDEKKFKHTRNLNRKRKKENMSEQGSPERRDSNNISVIKDKDENTDMNISCLDSQETRTPVSTNLFATFSSASKFSRKLNFQSESKMSYKKQKIDLESLEQIPEMNFKSSFKDLVNFDLSKEDSVNYNLFNKKNISPHPYKVLDAPLLKDDFYLHLLDWSKTDLLAVGLENSVYLWEGKSGRVVHLKSYDPEKVTSVKWTPEGNVVLIGLNSGRIHSYDVYRNSGIHTYENHTERVGVFSTVNSNAPHLFSSGSLDHYIINYDLRCKELSSRFVGHTQEVCGLKWSPDGKILASGGNDNKLMVWNLQKTTPLKKFSSHQSAIKAVGWSYHKHGLLASGGGTQDRTIKLWNTNTLSLVESIDTCSQVCNISFSQITNEFVTTHGYSDNLILVWDFEKLEVIATLKGHQERVIFMTMSPDGTKIATGAGDETIRFWEVFKQNKNETSSNDFSKLSKYKIR